MFSRTLNALLVAGILSLAAASAAQAAGKLGGSTGADHAKAAPACGYECPVLAGDGGPGSPTDGTGRSGARMADDGSRGRR